MAATLYITESWLAENASLTAGGEVHLPADSRLTPAARDLLGDRKIRIRYMDELGRVFVDGAAADTLQQVHPLTSSATHETAHCLLCQQAVGKKPDALTHLDASTLVAKNDPRIAFRGRLDSAIAHAVLLQTQWQAEAMATTLQRMLADIRAALGNVLRCETLGEPMLPIAMGDFDEAQIHALSHNPLKHLGHDHIVPAIEHGLTVARLNLLRTAIREAEVAGAQAFIGNDFSISRGDLLQALNRLSSAVYVLMLISWNHQKSGNNS
jgi:ethanolamine utilization cobalamin adenosyltransferase